MVKKCAVLGFPINHSLSPKIHKYWMQKYKIDGDYQAIAVQPENLQNQLINMKKESFLGANLTIPLKEIMLKYCDEVSDAAQKIGAINTISFIGNKIIGDNTDAYGFIIDCRQKSGIDYKGKKVVLIGAGGASRAIIYGLLEADIAELLIINRTAKRAESLKEFYQEFYPSKIISVGSNFEDASNFKDFKANTDLIINSSSMGMGGQNDIVMDFDGFPHRPDMIVYDIVYKPLETKFLSDARNANLRTVNGLGMLLSQAAYAFNIWFGVFPEIDDDLEKIILAK